MKVNSKYHYGILAMLELALNDKPEGLFLKDIAQCQQISPKYLAQVLTELKKAELIRNVLGRNTGYILTKKASDISLYDICRAFDPEIALLFCVEKPLVCDKKSLCASHRFFCGMSRHIRLYMQNCTLADLAEQEAGFRKELAAGKRDPEKYECTKD